MRETLGAKTVHTDVQAIHARIPQRRGLLRQEASVGGHTQLLQPVNRRQAPADVQNPSAHQRLAAGETNFFHAAAHCRPSNFHALLHRQNIPVRTLVNALLRHAVAAAVIAQICYRQPQISDCAAAAVGHKRLRDTE
ncbi:hypothetical protein SDC9_181249 [bioreactor metagenome]|uniref:Uncharacterized protein n=1 Tax=bioreactor metagenome TaxID=1076179 RepID=A0A645H415_9ZZZZ